MFFSYVRYLFRYVYYSFILYQFLHLFGLLPTFSCFSIFQTTTRIHGGIFLLRVFSLEKAIFASLNCEAGEPEQQKQQQQRQQDKDQRKQQPRDFSSYNNNNHNYDQQYTTTDGFTPTLERVSNGNLNNKDEIQNQKSEISSSSSSSSSSPALCSTSSSSSSLQMLLPVAAMTVIKTLLNEKLII